MARRSILVLIVLILAVAGATVWAQTRRDPTATTSAPLVISGENIGVRVTSGSNSNGPVRGTLVVRIDGRWVDVVSPTLIVTTGK